MGSSLPCNLTLEDVRTLKIAFQRNGVRELENLGRINKNAMIIKFLRSTSYQTSAESLRISTTSNETQILHRIVDIVVCTHGPRWQQRGGGWVSRNLSPPRRLCCCGWYCRRRCPRYRQHDFVPWWQWPCASWSKRKQLWQ